MVTVGANEEQMLQVRRRAKRLEQSERSRVRPLEIIEKNHQWVCGLGKHAQKVVYHEVETVASVGGRHVRHSRLWTDKHLQFREELNEESSVRLQRSTECITPRRLCGIAVRKQMAYKTLKRLDKRR